MTQLRRPALVMSLVACAGWLSLPAGRARARAEAAPGDASILRQPQ